VLNSQLGARLTSDLGSEPSLVFPQSRLFLICQKQHSIKLSGLERLSDRTDIGLILFIGSAEISIPDP
jgi:hypothetical protein